MSLTTSTLASNSDLNSQWSWTSHKRSWLGCNFTVNFGSYLNSWWQKDKTTFFKNILTNTSTSMPVDFYSEIEQMPLELKEFIQNILKFEKINYKKALLLENRGHLLVYVEKNGKEIEISFFSRHFSHEKILLNYFSSNNEMLLQLQKYAEILRNPNHISDLEFLTKKYNLPDLINTHSSPVTDENIASELSLRAHAYTCSLLSLVNDYQSSWFEKFSDFGLSLVSEYSALRLHLLKFLAILPCLDHDHEGVEVKRLFRESLILLKQEAKKNRSTLPWYVALFLPLFIFFVQFIPASLLSSLLRFSAKVMAKRFIAGENIQTSLHTLTALNLTQRDATLDQLGELVLSSDEADNYLKKVLEIIQGLKQYYPKAERNPSGILRAHISVKTTALGEQLKPQAFDDCYQKIGPRLLKILRAAKAANVFVNIDAEHYHFRDLVWRVYSKVLMDHSDLYSWKDTGIVVQAYLVDATKHLQEIFDFQFERKIRMPIRLVKGAYWDAETIEAQAHHFEPPQFLNKIETDLHFRQLAYKLISNPYTQLVVASHNIHDHCWVESLRTTLFPRTPIIEHQCLHMTYEALSVSLAKMGFVVRNYMPVGNLLVGMAYLVRRIMENSSQVGVLKMLRSHNVMSAEQDLLKDWNRAQKNWHQNPQEQYSPEVFHNHSPFRPYFKNTWEQSNLVQKNIRATYPIKWGADGSSTTLNQQCYSPSKPELLITNFDSTDSSQVHKIMETLHSDWAQSSWHQSTLERTSAIIGASELMVVFRDEISALIVDESGKSKTEAYGDVDEAIDFLNFYLNDFLEQNLDDKKKPLGVVAAITPWNFPFAIPAGMVVAPLIAGNAVVLKSAEQTPLIAHALTSILWFCGVPKNILLHFVGLGETVGAAVTTSKDLHGLVFTGSVTVGSMLYRNIAGTLVHNKIGNSFIRPVITEMGGKNPIVVTKNAELDETISGVLYSAFAHAGQKCSACSRVLVDKSIMAIFRKRLVASIQSIKVGDPDDPSVIVNPLITAQDKSRLIEFKKQAVNDALSYGGNVLVDRQEEFLDKNIIGPLVIEIPKKRAMSHDSLAQKEAFGPIIHLIAFDNLAEALEIANATNFALTAGIYAQSQSDISYFMQHIQSGNVYVNRPNTGARVGIEPFGGFKLSGTGPKAGGKSYIEQFMHFPITVEIEDKKITPKVIMESRPELLVMPKQLNPNFDFIKKTVDAFEDTKLESSAEDEKYFLIHYNYYKNSLKQEIQEFNTPCPGQTSYSNWNCGKDLILFWHFIEKLSVHDYAFILHATAEGKRLLVVVEDMHAYQFWKTFNEALDNCGYPRGSIVIWIGTFNVLKNEIKKLLSLDMVYIATNSQEIYQTHHQELISVLPMQQQLTTFLSTFSSLAFEKPVKLQKLFSHERAFAVNVMRHGAPLE